MVDFLYGGAVEDRLIDNAGNGVGPDERVAFYLDPDRINRVTDLRLADGGTSVTEVATDAFGYWPQVYADASEALWVAPLDYTAEARQVTAHNAVTGQKGVAGGLATLDDAGTVPLGQVPSIPAEKITGLEQDEPGADARTVFYVDGHGGQAVQAALDAARAAGGGIVINAQPGEHLLDDMLRLHRDTTLWSVPGVRYARNRAGMTALLIIETNGNGGYGGAYNVGIIGGNWDCMASTFGAANPCSGIAFGHCHRVRIADLVIRNVSEYHGLGIHGSKHVLIENCEFLDQVSGRPASEAIQIDAMYGAGAFGHYGPYDDTMCDHITIRDCIIEHNPDGIGSHNGPDGYTHGNIRIANNIIRYTGGIGIRLRQWENVTIEGNLINQCERAILFGSESSPPARYGFRITNNQIRNASATADAVVWVQGDTNNHAGRVSGNRITESPCDGVTIGAGNSDWIMSDNVVEVGQTGLYTYGASRVMIDSNRAVETTGTKGAILVRAGSTSVTVTSNTASAIDAGGVGTNYIIITGNVVGQSITTGGESVVRKHHNIEGGSWVA